MMILYSAGPLCSGCQIIEKALERAEVAFVLRDIRTLTDTEISALVTDLRCCGWAEKMIYSVDGEPILQAPIVQNETGALWASFLLPNGREVNPAFLDAIHRVPPPELDY